MLSDSMLPCIPYKLATVMQFRNSNNSGAKSKTPKLLNPKPCYSESFPPCHAESKEYCEFCAMKVEHWVLPMIFLSYAAVVAIIFGVAQSSSASNLDSPVG